MSTSDSCINDKSNDDDVCEVNNMVNDMSLNDIYDNNVAVCANCGNESSDVTNICNKCKKVKYCNAACKKRHRHKHKKECEEHVKLAAERAAKLHDEELFKQPPPAEDCPICFQQLPLLNPTGKKYYACCGKVICSGCTHAPVYDNQGNEVDNQKCPFCRTPFPKTDKEEVKRLRKRAEVNDPKAIQKQGNYYSKGEYEYPQDYTKALECWHRAVELGLSEAYNNIGVAYYNGQGVEVDKKKAIHYYELAAMAGCVMSRFNLGVEEVYAGNKERTLKHFMIAVRGGCYNSLNMIKKMYSNEYATKEDYIKALQLYQEYLGDIKSAQRDKAAAYSEEVYRYY